MVTDFLNRGWQKFPCDPKVQDWVLDVLPKARAAVEDPSMRAHWLRAGGTWMVGVNALSNDAQGRVGGGPPLAGAVMEFIDRLGFGGLALDPAQISVVWPGYPRRDPGESEAAFAFRQRRAAAHVDGVKTFGNAGRRHLGECHAYLLGLPLTETGEGASPLVLWNGSHEVMRRGLLRALGDVPEADWGKADITEAYQAARREVFETCPKLTLHARPGEAYLLHRLTLHGVEPWQEGAMAPGEGRMIAYFRPELPGGAAHWLKAA